MAKMNPDGQHKACGVEMINPVYANAAVSILAEKFLLNTKLSSPLANKYIKCSSMSV